jgi:hypothetical protein
MGSLEGQKGDRGVTGLLHPKPRLRALVKADKAKALAKVDRAENAKVKARSMGRSELREWIDGSIVRSTQRASEIHHLIGAGRRNRGASILATHKLHVSAKEHRDITGHVLQPVNIGQAREWAELVLFERRT